MEDRPAERDVRCAVAVGPDGHVPAGHDELELVAARLAEDGATQPAAPRLDVVIVLELLDEALVPVGVENTLEDVEQDRSLLVRVEIAGEERFRDGPEVRHMAAKQAAFRVLVIP